MWLLFLTIHLLGNTGYNLLLRKSLVANTDRWTLATIMQTGLAIPMVILLFITPPSLSQYNLQSVLLVIVTALLVVLFHVTNIKTLQYLEVGNFSVLYNLRIIITTVLGILFLHEDTNLLRITGGLLIFLAIIAIRQKGSKEATTRGISWGIATAITVSLLNLAEKSTINAVGYLGYAIPVMLLATVIVWTITLVRKQPVPFSTFTQPVVLLLMLFRAASAFSFTLALSIGGAISVSNYISSLGVVLTVVSGTVFLGERDNLKSKIFATALAVLGLTVILVSRL